MAKKKLIVVWPYRFRDFDWQRFELEQLSQHVEVHVHELIDALTPEFAAAYANQSERPEVKRFSSLKDWRREVKRSSSDSIVFTHVRPTSLKSVMVCFVLRRNFSSLVGFDTGGVPAESFLAELKYQRVKSKLKELYHLTRRNLVRLISPNKVLVGGSESENRVYRDYPNRVQLIFGSSSDYSQTLTLQSDSNGPRNNSVFLDTGFPGFPRDELLMGVVESVSASQWYPRLLNFFDYAEKIFDCKTVIAAHPKHVGRDHSKYYGSKTIVAGQTMMAVLKSVLVIATNSTSISYAVTFGKPLILVTCHAIEQSGQNKKILIKNCAFETGAKIFNIDREYTEKELRDALVIDHAKRESYKRKYLTSRNDDKPNYQVLLDEVINVVD